MPGVPCKVLNSSHYVMGADFHKNIPPPPPVGPMALPHVICAVMQQADAATAQMSTTVLAGLPTGYALARQHDLGRGVYHFMVNALLPLVCLGAGNKSEFGVATVAIDKGRLAVACIPIVGINLQLDCNDYPWFAKASFSFPTPTSVCNASANTVVAGFTLGDFFGGLLAGVSDALITAAVSKISSLLVEDALPALIDAIAGPEAVLIVGLVGAAFPTSFQYAQDSLELLIGWAIGTPLGYSPDPDKNPFHFGLVSKWGGKLNEGINNWISPTPKPPK